MIDQLAKGSISRKQAARSSPKVRRKAEQQILDIDNEKKRTVLVVKKKFGVLYRVQFDPSNKWVFICKACLEKLKPDNPHYRYEYLEKMNL